MDDIPGPNCIVSMYQGCSSCHSTGWVQGKLTKRQRYEYKIAENTSIEEGTSKPERPKGIQVKCKVCQGIGIVEMFENVNSFEPIRSPFVVIAGGGIGGVALALALMHRNIKCTVLEKDASFDARSQGYGLTMQQAATTLKRLGLQDVLLKNGVASESHSSFLPDGSLLSIYGRCVHSTTRATGGNGKGDDQRYNVQLPRQDLRRMMLDHLNPELIQWGSCVEKYKVNAAESPPVTVFLQGDKVIKCDLLVGADGIYSKIRMQRLPSRDPKYLGLIVILGRAKCTHPTAVNRVFQTLGGETRLYVMPFSDDIIMWQLSFKMSLEDARELSARGQSAMKEEAIRRCGTWHDPIPQLLHDTVPEDITGYPGLDMAPPEISDEEYIFTVDGSEGYVTLLGDAIHPMSPFKGQGANQALVDAWTLAMQLASAEDLPVSHYEKEMVKRVTPKVEQSSAAAAKLHSEEGIDIRKSRLLT